MGEADGLAEAAWEELIESYEIVVPLLLKEGLYREVIQDCEAILRKLGEPQGQGGPVAVQGRHNP